MADLILVIVLLAVALAVAIAYILHLKGFLKRLFGKKKPFHQQYVWLGEGKHPFKK